jgi:hypothetical protein
VAGILTQEQKQLAFRLRGRGWRLVDIAREIGCSAPMVGLMVRDGRFTTGVADQWEPRPGSLSIADREDILVGIRAGETLSSIARRLHRAPSTSAGTLLPMVAGMGTRPGMRTSGPASRPGDRSRSSCEPAACWRR